MRPVGWLVELLRATDPDRLALVSSGRSENARTWAAMMLALDLDTCESVLRGLPVRAGNLDAFVLRRALRGGPLPQAESYLTVDVAMLDAVAEAGPLPKKGGR